MYARTPFDAARLPRPPPSRRSRIFVFDLSLTCLLFSFQVFIEAYPEPTRQLNYKKLNLQRFDPGAVVRYDEGFHLVSDPIRKPGWVMGRGIVAGSRHVSVRREGGDTYFLLALL